jgi:hypothetical protein
VSGHFTFLLNSENYNVIISSRFDVIKQYIAQKNIARKGLLETSTELPNIDLGNFPISGFEGQSDDTLKLIARYVADVLPFFGTINSITELISGKVFIEGYNASQIVTDWELNITKRE